MPYKFEGTPINNPLYDKRVRLTDKQRETIKEEYELGLISIRGLERKYGVSRRLIQFILFPERQELAKKKFAERQKDGRYYDKDKHKVYMKNHRDHKKELVENGVLKLDE